MFLSKSDLENCGFAKFVEWVPCNLCGSDDFRIIYPNRYEAQNFSGDRVKSFAYASSDRARGNIVRCNNCFLAYMTPRDKDVYALYEGVEDDYYFSSRDDRTVSFERDLRELHKTLGVSDSGGKKLLDIGCSYGFFMDVAKKSGWDVYGCELSKKQYEFAAKNHANICNKQVQECGFQDNFFDVVTLYDVLEHVTSPSNFLRDVRQVLKPGGTLVITTPDLASPSAKVMGRFWINFARMHLYYFTPETVSKLLGKAGFTMTRCARHKRVAKLGVIVKWMSKYPLIYGVVNFLLNNRFTKDIRFSSSLSGNMTVYAKKI